jgi:hypothetical protein
MIHSDIEMSFISVKRNHKFVTWQKPVLKADPIAHTDSTIANFKPSFTSWIIHFNRTNKKGNLPTLDDAPDPGKEKEPSTTLPA